MRSLENNPLRLTRAGILMATWGVLVLVGGVLSQRVFTRLDDILLLWGVLTVVGVAVQVLCQMRAAGANCWGWIIAVIVGWAFTLYVTKVPNFDFYGDLAGVWLLLFGLAYVLTARQIDSRFTTLAVIHLLLGGLIELSARGMIRIEFLDTYSSLLLGLVGGGGLLIAASMARIPQRVPLRAQPPA